MKIRSAMQVLKRYSFLKIGSFFIAFNFLIDVDYTMTGLSSAMLLYVICRM